MLYHIEELQKILTVALYTGWLKDESPVSLLIVGPSGIGKSKLICNSESANFLRTDSISSMGLFQIAMRDPQSKLKFLLIPDLNPTLSRKPSTVESVLSNLLSFTSDGTVRIDDGRTEKTCKHLPIGVLTASTAEMYKRNSRKWYNLGLRRRIIPIFYRYSLQTISKLQLLVAEDKIHSSIDSSMQFNKKLENAKPFKVHIPAEFEQKIIAPSTILSILIGKDSYSTGKKKPHWEVREVIPISPQITLKNMARAHALSEGRAVVNQKDMDFLFSFLSFCDPENPKQL